MDCERSRKMLYLYREGELSNREAEELVQHLHACESCRLEQHRLATLDETVGRVRSFVPTVEDPNALTRAIMTSIRSSRRAESSGILDNLLDFFAFPVVRISSASFIVLATGAFLFQYLTLFADIHSLESTAGFRSSSLSYPATLYSVESTEAIKLAESKEVQRLIPTGQYRIVAGQILVPQSNVSSLLSTHDLRSITSFVASSVLRIDKTKMDAIIENISKNYTTVTSFGQ